MKLFIATFAFAAFTAVSAQVSIWRDPTLHYRHLMCDSLPFLLLAVPLVLQAQLPMSQSPAATHQNPKAHLAHP